MPEFTACGVDGIPCYNAISVEVYITFHRFTSVTRYYLHAPNMQILNDNKIC